MSLVWRKARLGDLRTIIALIRQDARTPPDEGTDYDRLEEAFRAVSERDDAFLIVGEDEGVVIATYQLFIIEAVSISAPRRGQIEDVRVDEGQRRKGVGAALMADAESRAHAAGATLVQLMSSQTRHGTHVFYETLGYERSHFGFKKRL